MKTRIILTQEDMMLLSYILENMTKSDLMAYCQRECNSDINYLSNKLKKEIKKNNDLIEKQWENVCLTIK